MSRVEKCKLRKRIKRILSMYESKVVKRRVAVCYLLELCDLSYANGKIEVCQELKISERG